MNDTEVSVRLLIGIADDSYSMINAGSIYASVSDAADIAGVSYETMSDWASSPVDPIPHIPIGKAKKLIRVSAIPAYAKTKEVS